MQKIDGKPDENIMKNVGKIGFVIVAICAFVLTIMFLFDFSYDIFGYVLVVSSLIFVTAGLKYNLYDLQLGGIFLFVVGLLFLSAHVFMGYFVIYLSLAICCLIILVHKLYSKFNSEQSKDTLGNDFLE